VIIGSLAITAERSKRIAFSRPIRFVDQLVVVRTSDTSIQELADLAGQEVTVREGSSYAEALRASSVKGIRIKAAPESLQTLDLLQRVARGEEAITVSDSDLFAAALSFAPNLRSPFKLLERQPIAWGLRKSNSDLKAAIDSYLVEHALTESREAAYRADLDEIKRRKVLRVLTRNTSSTFFIYRGEQLGFEYELAREFAKTLGVRLEVVIPPSREALLQYLESGRGDLAAAGMARTPERERRYALSAPYQFVSELLIVPAKDTKTRGLPDLKGKSIWVRKSSSYYETLSDIRDQLGFTIELLPEDLETEDVLAQVGAGKIPAAMADSNIVELELTYNNRIRSVGPVGDVVEIGWVMRQDQPALKAEVDAFMKKLYKGAFYNQMVSKYFKDPKRGRSEQSLRADKGGALSPYDGLVKKHARTYELDWRLITAQMYQESQFNPKATSWVGAKGLMQVMPRTGQELKVANLEDPDQGILAGVKLMARYSNLFNSPEIPAKDRIRFALASYNCGPGHVDDARELAREMGLSRNKWFGNVEQALLLLGKREIAKKARYGFCRCDEPVNYVSQIQQRYEHYVQIVPMR
ncbi:MAG TPA: transporter substrate-binding domain-containing protein, partial [Candidatus Methylomirabilis sp.]|nr:transporter substrate-binding domain-containing protein [Candidatus Methylomirabilis sp.]